MDKMYWDKRSLQVLLQIFLDVFIVIEGGTKITSLMTRALALQPDEHAIPTAVAPPAERYGFEFRRSTMVKHIASPIHLLFFSISAWYCVYLAYRVQMYLGYLTTRRTQPLSQRQLVPLASNRPVTPALSAGSGCRYTSEPQCVAGLAQSCRTLSELQSHVSMVL